MELTADQTLEALARKAEDMGGEKEDLAVYLEEELEDEESDDVSEVDDRTSEVSDTSNSPKRAGAFRKASSGVIKLFGGISTLLTNQKMDEDIRVEGEEAISGLLTKYQIEDKGVPGDEELTFGLWLGRYIKSIFTKFKESENGDQS